MADPALDPTLSQKKRARRRLVGAAALCLAAAIALPLLFDSEPRRPQQSVQVDIPSRDMPLPTTPAAPAGGEQGGEARPPSGANGPDAGAVPARPTPSPGATSTPGAPAESAAPADGRAGRPEARPPESRPAERTGDKPGARPGEKPADKPAAPPAGAPPTAAPGKGGKGAAPAAAERRYVLQIGAFASQKGASEQVDKVKANGLSAYTEKIRTAQGERIRVRVGPFATREQAEQARGQLKLVGIDSALIAP